MSVESHNTHILACRLDVIITLPLPCVRGSMLNDIIRLLELLLSGSISWETVDTFTQTVSLKSALLVFQYMAFHLPEIFKKSKSRIFLPRCEMNFLCWEWNSDLLIDRQTPKAKATPIALFFDGI